MKLTRLTALAAAIALIATACGSGVTETAGSDGANEGIQVHGHWTLDIYNEDGSLDESHEFENALTDQGARALVRLLADHATVHYWSVYFRASVDAQMPCSDGINNQTCTMYEPSAQLDESPYQSKNLSVSVDMTQNALVLSGSHTAVRDGLVETVGTNLTGTFVNTTATQTFTSKDVTTLDQDQDGQPDGPIDVAEGQQVQVTVEISFS